MKSRVDQCSIFLTAAQRKVVADLLPKLASRLKLDEKNSRTISFTTMELESIREKVEAARSHADTGMIRNSLRHIESGVIHYTDAPVFYEDFDDKWRSDDPLMRYAQRIDVEGWDDYAASGIPWHSELDIDWRATERDGQPAAEFSFDGLDEMTPTSGRGWAVLEGNTLDGMIFFHQGDESGFKAKQEKGRRNAEGTE